MSLYTMADAYETAEFKRRKPMTARAKQAISRALKGKRKRRRGGGMSLTGRTTAGKAVRAIGATAALAATARYGGRGLSSAMGARKGGAGLKGMLGAAGTGIGRQVRSDAESVAQQAGQAARQAKGLGLRAKRAANNTGRRIRKGADKLWNGNQR
jgi:hypothetical protein